MGFGALRSSILKGRRWITIGIRREDKNRWETRAPLTPAHAKELQKLSNVQVVVQPCSKRIFTDKEYSEIGINVAEDLSDCDVIIGIKEIPAEKIVPGKTHLCFSHTHKGQPSGAPLLAAFKEKKATLVDYELLTDEKRSRILAFGKFAGYAGMIDCLHGLGDRFLQLGYRTPFLNIGLAHHYPSLAAAKKAVQLVAKEIEKQGLPPQLNNLSFVFTGTGNVSTGAQDIFKLLPHKMVKPKELEGAMKKDAEGHLIGAVLEYSDFTVANKTESIFASKYAPYTNVLINGVYWDKNIARILTKEELATLQKTKDQSIYSIADISCDINGGIECTSRATSIESPFMYYNPIDKTSRDQPSSPQDIQILSIDNLPAQLPRDASSYFSTTLVSILKEMIKTKKATAVIERATVVKEGVLVDRFITLNSDIPETRNILILGSGYVSKPAIDYLASNTNSNIVVASNSVADLKRVTAGVPKTSFVHLEAGESEKLSQLVKDSKVVVSLLPASMHTEVAEHCINYQRSMVTGSYISPEMMDLTSRVKAADITILNEIGLDPGLDHLSAMKLIEEVKSQGDKIESFVSWCGGLPAPECADNPFGYKFSWRPQGVLTATQNPARYLLGGKTVNVTGPDLLRSAMPIKIHNAFAFEGIPNRDSMGYIEQYGLQGVQTMFRGTLRYRGFAELMDSCARIGLLKVDPLGPVLGQKKNWRQVMDTLVPRTSGRIVDHYAKALGSSSMVAKSNRLINALEWLGAFDASEPFHAGPTMMDSFAGLLEKKMAFSPGERDMAFMFHELQVTSPAGKKQRLTSTLIQYGDPHGYSAMAKTVGLPVAIAAELLLNGKVNEKGVIAPLSKTIYEPMLSTLKTQEIIFKETSSSL